MGKAHLQLISRFAFQFGGGGCKSIKYGIRNHRFLTTQSLISYSYDDHIYTSWQGRTVRVEPFLAVLIYSQHQRLFDIPAAFSSVGISTNADLTFCLWVSLLLRLVGIRIRALITKKNPSLGVTKTSILTPVFVNLQGR